MLNEIYANMQQFTRTRNYKIQANVNICIELVVLKTYPYFISSSFNANFNQIYCTFAVYPRMKLLLDLNHDSLPT